MDNNVGIQRQDFISFIGNDHAKIAIKSDDFAQVITDFGWINVYRSNQFRVSFSSDEAHDRSADRPYAVLNYSNGHNISPTNPLLKTALISKVPTDHNLRPNGRCLNQSE